MSCALDTLDGMREYGTEIVQDWKEKLNLKLLGTQSMCVRADPPRLKRTREAQAAAAEAGKEGQAGSHEASHESQQAQQRALKTHQPHSCIVLLSNVIRLSRVSLDEI